MQILGSSRYVFGKPKCFLVSVREVSSRPIMPPKSHFNKEFHREANRAIACRRASRIVICHPRHRPCAKPDLST
jgi:hypothetical protein